jgi:hypothetical protein
MKHLTEEELIAQAIGERQGEGADAVEEHLAACEECADSYLVLLSDLAAMKPVTPPDRDEWYGERVWQSIAPSLAAYRARNRGWRRGWRRGWLTGGVWKGLGYAAACALLVVGAFFAGRQWEHSKQRQPTARVEQKVPQHETADCGGGSGRSSGPLGAISCGTETCRSGLVGDGVADPG